MIVALAGSLWEATLSFTCELEFRLNEGFLMWTRLPFQGGAGGDDKSLAIRLATGVWLWASAVVVSQSIPRTENVSITLSSQDITNTATLCVLLRSRVKGYNQNTDSVIKSLMLLAVETAAYTTVIAAIGGKTSDALRQIISWLTLAHSPPVGRLQECHGRQRNFPGRLLG